MKNQLEVVYGRTGPLELEKKLVAELGRITSEGTMYIGYPIIHSGDSQHKVDVLFASQQYGLVVFDFQHFKQDVEIIKSEVKDHQDSIFTALAAKMMTYPPLTKNRNLAVVPQLFSIHKDYSNFFEDNTLICTFENIKNYLKPCDLFTSEYYRNLNAFIQRSTSLRPKKSRAGVQSKNSYGAKIKTIERQVANLDPDQKKAAIESCDGPQRIRGLAGSGKTIVLAQKAALLHVNNPNWRIVITYYTQTLYDQFVSLVRKFTYEHNSEEPDWSKLTIMHAWGSNHTTGVYHEVCRSINHPVLTYEVAKNKYGFRHEFEGACQEVIEKHIPEIYDVAIVDEAQDFPQPFFELIYHATKKPKCIIYAYDELQSLSYNKISPPEKLFGLRKNGKPRVQLRNHPSRPKQDIVLPVCYRNPPWILSAAHALGFGVHRKDGLVQMFKDAQSWYDVGYKSDSDIEYGHPVDLERSEISSPSFFKEHIDMDTSLLFQAFRDRKEELQWVHKHIMKNLKEDELDPDDILIIVADPQKVGELFNYIREIFANDNVAVHSPGIGRTSRRTFFKPSSILISSVYRAKGNEAPVVYLVGAEYCAIAGRAEVNLNEVYSGRNFLFTALTRSRGWARVSGVGEEMKNLKNEFLRIKEDNFSIKFIYPTKNSLQKIHTLHEDLDEPNENFRKYIRKLDSGEITWEQVPETVKKTIRRGRIPDSAHQTIVVAK